MPIYEYVCRECGAELEKLQGLSDPAPVDCPECQAPALRRKLSAAGFRLAGGGWYETDFKKDGKRNLAGEGKKDKESKSGAAYSAGEKSADKGAKSDKGASDGKAAGKTTTGDSGKAVGGAKKPADKGAGK